MATVEKEGRLDLCTNACRLKAGSLAERLSELAMGIGYMIRTERDLAKHTGDPLERRLRELELEKCRITVERNRRRAEACMSELECAWTELDGELALADLLAACPDSE